MDGWMGKWIDGWMGDYGKNFQNPSQMSKSTNMHLHTVFPMRSESYEAINNSMSTWRSLGLDSESELKYIKKTTTQKFQTQTTIEISQATLEAKARDAIPKLSKES